jgi:hypothetical protein
MSFVWKVCSILNWALKFQSIGSVCDCSVSWGMQSVCMPEALQGDTRHDLKAHLI